MHKYFFFIILITITPSITASKKQKSTLFEAVHAYNADQDQTKHFNTISSLLQSNPDMVHARDSNQFTPLFHACSKGNNTLVKLLLNHKADIDSQNNRFKDSPLMIAATNGHTSVVYTLLQRKAFVNIQAANGNTPLHNATGYCRKDIVEMLLVHNANPNIANIKQTRPLDLAYSYVDAYPSNKEYPSIAKLLLAASTTISNTAACSHVYLDRPRKSKCCSISQFIAATLFNNEKKCTKTTHDRHAKNLEVVLQ